MDFMQNILEMKRSELPDDVFGIPQERKYPMPDEKHVRSAIKLFNHVEDKYEEQLAKKIIANMKKYDIDPSIVGPNNRLRNYLPKNMTDKKSVVKEQKESAPKMKQKKNTPIYNKIVDRLTKLSTNTKIIPNGLGLNISIKVINEDDTTIFVLSLDGDTSDEFVCRTYLNSLIEEIKYSDIGQYISGYNTPSDSRNTLYIIIKDQTVIKENEDAKIDTLIFDLGNVLITGEFENQIRSRFDPNIADAILSTWYMGPDNPFLDSFNEKEYLEWMSKRLPPEIQPYLAEVQDYNIAGINVYEYTYDLLKKLKEGGYRLYYLSNWSRWGIERLKSESKLNFLDMFDGGVFSYQIGAMKPDPAMYRFLIMKYNLIPSNCIFFDDKKENCKAAERLGINAVQFDHSTTPDQILHTLIMVTEHNAPAGGGNAMIGTGQAADSVYIVNYMQNNAFSGEKEQRFGICNKGMYNCHIFDKKGKKKKVTRDEMHDISNEIEIYKYNGEPKHDLDTIVKEANNDTDFYTLLTGKFLLDRSILESDADFSKDKDLTKELAAIRECIGATILKGSGERDVPILTNYVQGRPYNYYRDFDGVFIHNSLTNLRSESYPNIDCIPEEVEELIKNYPF